MRQLLFLIVTCFVCTIATRGQLPRADRPASNLRKKFISTHHSSIRLDSLSIIPKTLSVLGIGPEAYTIDYVNAELHWKQPPPTDSIWVQYRVFSSRLNAVVRQFTYDSVMNNFFAQSFVTNEGPGGNDRFFDFGNIQYSGSFGRGISFGNSQDAVLTSSLNLQISGYLADSIEIVAAITDNNIPIQPDGTTQQLNEFDRIFLQFKKKTWALSLGDIDIRQNKSYFLNFYKRLQGGSFETTNQLAKNISNYTLVSGSIAKGKFVHNVITGQEGNQGPYRLTGANNELFFVVLANTERVYIDGELLQRGEDRDYVINYNTAEVTFTPKRMVTKDSRIQVDFEYADRNFLNANLFLTNQTNFNNKLRLTLSAFNNSDAKSSPINQSLDATQKNFLASLGDSINRAYYPIATTDTFSAGRIMYKKIDTTYNSGAIHDSVFVYSISPDSARYTLSFSEVGAGKGDYIADFTGANGKVYRWVAPVNGVKQGSFTPATFLVTPKKQQLLSMVADYDLNKRTNITTELAMSDYDVNTFSKLDKADNKGYAARVQLRNTLPLGGRKGLELASSGGYEMVDARFHPLERLRNVEFNRDWNLPATVNAAREQLINAATQLSDKNKNSLQYSVVNYTRDDGYSGLRNVLTQSQSIKGWRFNNRLSYTTTSSNTDKGFFFRPTVDISKTLTKLRNYSIGFTYSVERSEIRDRATDTVSPLSFSFQNIQVALRSPGNKPNKWSVTYFVRENSYPYGKSLIKADRSQNVNLSGELARNPREQFRWNITYRKLDILRPGLTTQQADNSLLGRLEYAVNEWRGLLTGNMLYETGSGQEQKRDYSYLEVPAGQGQYTWIDYNNDGIPQLNEFEVAQFQDQAKFIRIYTPTNQYIRANYNTFNYSVTLNPRSVINPAKAGALGKLLARINLQSSLQIAKKEISTGIVQLNPFKIPLSDTALISLNSVFVNTFSFNRFSTAWGLDLSNTRNSAKSLLTYGLESRALNEWSLKGRWNISRPLQLVIQGKNGYNQLRTPSFGNRNFNLEQYSIQPGISYTKGTAFRITTSYQYSNKKNTDSTERYSSSSVNAEMKYNILQ
ncbi:MAG: hypothetical protein JST39_06965, partial [Bacteroidetes bacterium]|nr:hypothetical protein [Bacteroidota bacterium]